jgi:hypothetical protein
LVALASLGIGLASASAAVFNHIVDEQNDKFCRIGDFMKYNHSKVMAVFYKIVKWVKNGVLMIIHNLRIDVNSSQIRNQARSQGGSIRCIKDL